jgi:hypothetical protein
LLLAGVAGAAFIAKAIAGGDVAGVLAVGWCLVTSTLGCLWARHLCERTPTRASGRDGQGLTGHSG